MSPVAGAGRGRLAWRGAVRARVGMAALLLGATAGTAGAQSGARIAEGRVLRADSTGDPTPVAGQWVVLHRVGADRAGPLDSVRSAANGRFRFRYQASGAGDALYFVSAMYGGIAYFSPPLRSAVVRGGEADVLVYDTTTDTASLRVAGRHLVISQARGSRREIAEIFEIENQSPRTVVANDTVPVWAVAIPEDAESVAVAPGDVSAAAVTFSRGRAALFAPLSPGIRQLVLTYLVPDRAFPVSFPMQRPTQVFELLMEDPRGSVEGIQVREMEAATIDGRTFRRLLAQDLPASAVARVDMPAPPGRNTRVLVAVAVTVASLMLLALLMWWSRRRVALPSGQETPAPTPVAPPPAASVDAMIAELAALDARHERAAGADVAADAAYRERRAELKARIERALAAGEVAS